MTYESFWRGQRGNRFAVFASGETGTEDAAYSACVKAVIKPFVAYNNATSQDGI